ncbi:MAG: hypothetical protein WAK31_27610 [Chthoniobacterales bacterium]
MDQSQGFVPDFDPAALAQEMAQSEAEAWGYFPMPFEAPVRTRPKPEWRERGLRVLLQYCRQHQLTCRQLGQLLGCYYSQAARILRGEWYPSASMAKSFQDATGVRAALVRGLD